MQSAEKHKVYCSARSMNDGSTEIVFSPFILSETDPDTEAGELVARD